MSKSNLIRLIVLILLISAIVVYFTVGFGWICQILIILMFIVSLCYPHFKKEDESK